MRILNKSTRQKCPLRTQQFQVPGGFRCWPRSVHIAKKSRRTHGVEDPSTFSDHSFSSLGPHISGSLWHTEKITRPQELSYHEAFQPCSTLRIKYVGKATVICGTRIYPKINSHLQNICCAYEVHFPKRYLHDTWVSFKHMVPELIDTNIYALCIESNQMPTWSIHAQKHLKRKQKWYYESKRACCSNRVWDSTEFLDYMVPLQVLLSTHLIVKLYPRK